MKKSFLVTTLVTFLPLISFSAEPSAFGAGDLDSSSPYGLTSNEKSILETKKNLHKIVVKSNNQANRVDSLRERIDGLQTIIESLSLKSHKNKIALQNINSKIYKDINNSSEYEKRLSKFTQNNKEDIDKLKLVITELSSLISTINSSYITKKEFTKLVDDVNRFKGLMAKELKGSSTSSSISKVSKLDKMESAQVAKDAKKFFDKKYYTKAIEYYTHLIEKNYKPARAHYMIGEMKFKRKNYAEAISYFKKSASLYSKASYMPSLMYHTAVSMDETGDIKNAKAFYNGLINKYPDSKFTKDARVKLSLIE